MTQRFFLLSAMALVLAGMMLAVGCGREEAPPIPQPETGEPAPAPDAAEPSATATPTDTTSPLDDEARSRYTEQIDARITSLQTQIDSLAEKAKSLAATSGDKLDATLAKLEDQSQALRAKAAELRQSTGERWQQLKQETDGLMDRVSRAYKAAVQELTADDHGAEGEGDVGGQ